MLMLTIMRLQPLLLACLFLSSLGDMAVKGFITSLTSHESFSRRSNVVIGRSSSSSDADHDSFMASLQKRVQQVTQNDSILPLVVLDSMLPRQVLKLSVNNGLLKELVKHRLEAETPYFGMLGMARLESGEQVHLKSGVQVEIVGKPRVTDDGTLQLELRAGKRFRIRPETVENAGRGWTQAQITYADSTDEDNAEWEEDGADPMSITRAMHTAREFTAPNMIMEESLSLVDTWIGLAREKERAPGQIDQLLKDLGPIPSWKEPSECAFWVGALINPIPAMGVAREIRPSLLVASTAEKRTEIALDGIWNSIQFMQGPTIDRIKE